MKKIVLFWIWLTVALSAQTPFHQWEVESLGLANNDPISTLPSLTTANDATQSAGKRPLYKTGGPNGHAYAHFDGVDDYLKLATALPDGACEIYMVVRSTNAVQTTDGMAILGRESGTSPQGALILGNASSTVFTNEILSWIRSEDGGATVYGAASMGAFSGWHIVSLHLNATRGTEVRIDGSLVALIESSQGAMNTTTRAFENVDVLGALRSDAYFLDGDIAEIQFYNAELTGAEQRSVSTALATKYGFSMPSLPLTAASVSQPDVQAAIYAAFADETVTIPAGGPTSWTTGISIIGINVIGATTVNPLAGTANNQTIILDDITANGRAFMVSAPLGKTARLSGITFNAGSRGSFNTNGIVGLAGAGTATGKVRLDNCNLENLEQDYAVKVYGAYGVIDHNRFYDSGNQSIHLTGESLDPEGAGDGTWADYPWFGTDKFMFIETNYFHTTNPSETVHCIDGDWGMRWVVRYNPVMSNTQTQSHGTENRVRGVRATETYNNGFTWNHSIAGMGGFRTGAHLIHDNTISGTRPNNWLTASNLRLINRFQTPVTNSFMGASGSNPWDVNDITNGTVTPGQTLTPSVATEWTFTNGNFTYTGVVNGLYESSTCTAGSNNTTVIDSTKSWTTNQWVGFVVEKVSDQQITEILSNTGTALTVTYGSGGSQQNPQWVDGDAYTIRRALITIDQPGRGKGDLIVNGWNTPPPATNNVSSTQSWPTQALEPIYNWNNIYDGTETFNFFPAFGDAASRIFVPGRDYFNDADGASNAAVIAKYTAALNGVDYTGPYTYPHPLVTGAPPPPGDSGSRKVGRGKSTRIIHGPN